MTTNPDLETDIPLDVYAFFRELSRSVETGNVDKLQRLYEEQFEQLTKSYYVSTNQWHPWPSLRLSIVAKNFKTRNAEYIYSFLYHKHLFTDRGVRQTDATASWKTFVELFSAIETNQYALPSWMLWDIFDEFVFQMTVVYQKCFSTSSEWSVVEAFRMMDEVVAASKVKEVMTNVDEVEQLTTEGYTRELSGFFAIITKAKMNVLLGDYYSALSDLEIIDIHGAGAVVLQKVSPANVSLLYNVGFSYLMLRRYDDASNSFRRCLASKLSGRKFSERLQLDAAYMYVCARVLGGMVLANVSSYIDQRKRFAFEDDKDSLRAGDEERFREVFDRCSPKFLSIPPPNTTVKGTEGKEQQARMFRRAVQVQQEIIRLRDYFGVYQNTKVSQLQKLLESDDSYATFFALKMSSRQLVHDGESADLLSGVYKVTAQNDCVVSGDNVEVVSLANFNAVESKIYNKIKSIYRAEQRYTQRKQNQVRARRGADGKPFQSGARRQNTDRQNNGKRNHNAGDQQRRPNQQRGNRPYGNAAPMASALADNLFNRNAN